jgi:hypothetical protein
MLHYSLLQRAPPENHCVLTQLRWPLRSNCCPAVQFDGGADRSLLDLRGACSRAERVPLALGELRETDIDLGLAGNARIVANAAEPFDPPEQIVIRESIDCVNRLAHWQIITKSDGIEESRGRSRSQTPFANSIATFAFISARSARIRRYLWN